VKGSDRRHGIVLAGVFLGLGLMGASPSQAEDEFEVGPGAFAVVELFTSEGCSSCPPADEVLESLVDQAQRAGLPIYSLSFHVDYWNRLGWTDPFSSPIFSQRQRTYGDRLEGGVYTPQAVVNGVEGFVGSDRTTLDRVLRDQLNRARRGDLRAQYERAEDQLVVDFEWSEFRKRDELFLAIVRSASTVSVPRGENAGRTLTHANVVVGWKAVEMTANQGSFGVDLPKDWSPASGEVICFVQNVGGGEIRGAARVQPRKPSD